MEVTAADATDCAKKVNTAERLQAFLALLKLVDVSALRKRGYKTAVMEELKGYGGRALQFLDLLTASYKTKSAGWGFCTLMVKYLTPWTEEEVYGKLDEWALVEEMYKNWCKAGPFSLVPEALLTGLQPAFKCAFDYPARELLGSSQPKAIASGMKLTKVLSGMFAIQTNLHTRTEPLKEELSGIENVNNLGRFDLRGGWEDVLIRSARKKRKNRDRKGREEPGVKSKQGGPNVDPDPLQFLCTRCGKQLATASSLARHVSWSCRASKNQKETGNGADANEEEPSGDETIDPRSSSQGGETRTGDQAHRSSKRRKPATADASDAGEDFDESAFYVATAINTRVNKIVGKGARLVFESDQ